jgi:two-component system response regulator DevR
MQRSASAAGAVPMTDAAPISVLIVDDHDEVGRGLARACQVDDLVVLGVAATAQEALAAVRMQAPDVVLMDNRLGIDSGPSVARKLLELAPASRIVIVTGAATNELRAEALAAGCVGCVEKTMEFGRRIPELIRRVHRGEPA